jgi:hypothetical protein
LLDIGVAPLSAVSDGGFRRLHPAVFPRTTQTVADSRCHVKLFSDLVGAFHRNRWDGPAEIRLISKIPSITPNSSQGFPTSKRSHFLKSSQELAYVAGGFFHAENLRCLKSSHLLEWLAGWVLLSSGYESKPKPERCPASKQESGIYSTRRLSKMP